jgi:hypothetical protein
VMWYGCLGHFRTQLDRRKTEVYQIFVKTLSFFCTYLSLRSTHGQRIREEKISLISAHLRRSGLLEFLVQAEG